MDKIPDLYKFVTDHTPIEEYPISPEAKKKFHTKGRALLKKLGKELKLKPLVVESNPGGFGIWGDVYLRGMWSDHAGIYVCLCGGSGHPLKVLYRTIVHIKDYSGGSNRWLIEGADAVEVISMLNKEKAL